MKKRYVSVPIYLLLIFASMARADVFHLQFNDEIYGGHQTLNLGKALRNQYQVNAGSLVVERVDVVIKSLYGGGQLWLGARYNQADRQTATGLANSFDNPADWTFSRLTFPFLGVASDLMLNLNGQFRLRHVTVHTREISDSTGLNNDGLGQVRITLPMHHVKLNGLSTVDIAQLLQNDAQLNWRNFTLNGITVALKSQQDGAQVWLQNGEWFSEIIVLNSAGEGFGSDNPASYHYRNINTVQVDKPSNPWLLRLNGDIKLYEIIISLNRR